MTDAANRDTAPMERLLTPDEIARLLNVQKATIYAWTHFGFIPHIKVGRLLRFREKDVLKWLEARSTKGSKSRVPDLRIVEKRKIS